jgi:hypothetical protein
MLDFWKTVLLENGNMCDQYEHVLVTHIRHRRMLHGGTCEFQYKCEKVGLSFVSANADWTKDWRIRVMSLAQTMKCM